MKNSMNHDVETLAARVVAKSKRPLLRHIVEREVVGVNEHGITYGEPNLTALCGYVCKIYPIPHGPDICQACVDEQRRRARGQA